MENLDLKLTKILFLRLTTIYGDKFVKNYPNEQIREIWYQDWLDGLSDVSTVDIKEAIKQCKLNLTWPPSLAEFRDLCDKSAGYPSQRETLESIINKNFTHPIIKICFDRIGSWKISNLKENDLMKIVRDVYQEAVNEFRNSPESSWVELQSFISSEAIQSKGLEKELTVVEIIGFKKKLDEWRKKAEIENSENKKKNHVFHPVWDVSKYDPLSRSFDVDYADKRKQYLISLDETSACYLDRSDLYDRIRFIKQGYAQNMLISYASKISDSKSSKENYHEASRTRSNKIKSTYDYI